MTVVSIHDRDFVISAVKGYLSLNQKCFKSIHEPYTPNSPYSVEHPITNEFFLSFITIYNTTHLMKKLINHWMTGKTVSYSLRVLMILEKHRLLNVVTLFLYTGKYRKIYQKDFH